MSSPKKSYRILSICIVIILICGILSALIKTNFGNVLVREVNVAMRGGVLSGEMYIPKDALSIDENGEYASLRPAVILCHGYLNSNQMQDPNAIELSRRGFVVFSMNMYGHGNSDPVLKNDDPSNSGSINGAIDAYNYMLSLPYIDHSRIAYVAHSMGGMNTGNATALLSGFYTKEDLLLNMLSEELGVSVTAQDVSEQNPDSVAENLDDYKKGIYDTRKQEIEVQYAKRPFAEVFMGSGPGFASLMQAHEVMVAGHPVWRDVQANVGVSIGMYEENSWLMFSAAQDGINSSFEIPSTTVARSLFETGDETVQRRTWYQINTSSTSTPVASTLIGEFDSQDPLDPAFVQAAKEHRLRAITQPYEVHAGNHFSTHTTSFVVDFLSQTMGYNCGELNEGAAPIDSSSFLWPIKEFANGIALAAMLVLLYPLTLILLDSPFFVSLKGTPADPVISIKDKGYWITTALLVLIPVITFIPLFDLAGAPTSYAGEKGVIPWSWFFSQEKATRIGIWALCNGLIAIGILFIKYTWFQKGSKRGFSQEMGLVINKKNLGKTILLAFLVCAFGYLLDVISVFFFAGSDFRMWVLAGRVMTPSQIFAWICYCFIFFGFYLANSMMVNSGRMKGMSNGKNLALCAIVNGFGITLFLLLNYAYVVANGYMVWYEFGVDKFLACVVIYPMVVLLPLAAIYGRKFYERTGTIYLGTFLNTFLMTWFVVGNTCFHYTFIQ